MFMEIKTNVGTFGNLRDIETFMRLEGLEKIEVISIKAMFSIWESLVGVYTYDEIKQAIDTKGVLE